MKTGCAMVWAVLPAFSITTTIIGTRIRMSALTNAFKIPMPRETVAGLAHRAKNHEHKTESLVMIQMKATQNKQSKNEKNR